jgi:hypothetical protein
MRGKWASAHGEYSRSWGTARCSTTRVPAHRTPSDVVAGLGVQFFPKNRSVDFDCSPSANLGRERSGGKAVPALRRLL